MPTTNPITLIQINSIGSSSEFEPISVQRVASAEIQDCICSEGSCGVFLDGLRQWASWLYRCICGGFWAERYADVDLYDALRLTPAELFGIPSLNVRLSKTEIFTLGPDRTETCRAICQKLVRDFPRLGLRESGLDLPRSLIDVLDDALEQSETRVKVEVGLRVQGSRETFEAYVSIESDNPLSLNLPASAGGWVPSCSEGSRRTVSILKCFESSRFLAPPRNPWEREIEFEISKEMDPVTIENRQFEALQNVFERLFKPVDNPRIEEILEEGISNERVIARAMASFFNSLPGNYRRPVHFSFQEALTNLSFSEEESPALYQEARISVNRMVGSFIEEDMIALPEPMGGWEFSHEWFPDHSQVTILCRRRLPNAV